MKTNPSDPQPVRGRSFRPVAAPQIVCRIKVTLSESAPAIWRQIEVPDSMTLLQLHQILQIVMGWEDYHLHEFTAHGKTTETWNSKKIRSENSLMSDRSS